MRMLQSDKFIDGICTRYIWQIHLDVHNNVDFRITVLQYKTSIHWIIIMSQV